MTGQNDVNAIMRGLEAKGYHYIEPPSAYIAAYSKRGFGGNTYVIALCEGGQNTMGPAEMMKQAEPWFKSVYGNMGNGLLLVVWPNTPAWAVDEVKQTVGTVYGGIIDPWSSFRWISSTLAWDKEIV